MNNGFNVVRPPQRALSDLQSFGKTEVFILDGYEKDGDGELVLDNNDQPIVNWDRAIAFVARPLTPREILECTRIFEGVDPFQVCQMLELANINRALQSIPDEHREAILLDTEEGKAFRTEYFKQVSLDVLRYAWAFVHAEISENTQMLVDVQVINEKARGGVMRLGRTPEEAYFDLIAFIFHRGGRVVGVDADGNPKIVPITRAEVETLIPSDLLATMVVDYGDRATDEDGTPTPERMMLWKALHSAGLIALPTENSAPKAEDSGKPSGEASEEPKTPAVSSRRRTPAKAKK